MSAEAEAGLPMTELDLRGDICPGPTAETLEALKAIPPGANWRLLRTIFQLDRPYPGW
jgi:hypothetical protein